jgi:tripartite-type tricarboxylate transporter receptor subunit TctC
MKLSQSHLLLLSIAAGFGANGSHAQSYPTKPIRILAAGAGSGGDFLARLVAAEISGPLGQPAVVENRTGGAILFIGAAKAAPDGYTLLVSGGALWTAPLLGEAPYDAVRDFAPIAALTSSPNLLIVHPSLPASVAGLIKLAKAKPGELNYASGATGTASHMAGELFKSLTGTDIVRIPYKDQAQQTVDSLSGQVMMTFGQGTSWIPLIKSGKLRALASTGSRRSLLYPDLPTVAETVPGFASEQAFGLFAPGKTPEAIIRRLNQETVRALEKPEARTQMLGNGQEPAGGLPEQLAEYMRMDMARIGKLIKDLGSKFGGS